MNQIADGFFFLFRGARELTQTNGILWLLVVPVLLNLAIFAVCLWAVVWLLIPALLGWLTALTFGVVLVWIITILIFLLLFVVYAFVFSMVAEVIGAPFYEGIGGKIDKKYKHEVVERSIGEEIVLAISQESRKLVAIIVVGFIVFVLQFAPVIGQLLSAGLGFAVLVITLGADAVGPALARRGLMLGERRKWVLRHLRPVIGMGLAKALGLVVPVFNIIVLPFASAGGTLLVQKYDKRKQA